MAHVSSQEGTLPETNSEFTPENGWLEDDFSFQYIFRGYVSFREDLPIPLV